MSLAQRRHDAARIKNNRKHNMNVQPTKKSIGMAIHTSALCSCWMCGNPRKFFNDPSIQEKRAIQNIDGYV